MKQTELVAADEDALTRAAQILIDGGVVAFPTDTVYGLCCDLFNVEAVQRIYQIKGRPANMPLIAMFADAEQWPCVATELSLKAQALIRQFWPGPLTVIAPARPDIPVEVLGGGNTIGMRIPDHAAARRLLRLVGRPLATTSANLSGHASPCSAQDVAAQLHGLVDMILDAGPCTQGMASTVLDCTTNPPKILREGPLTRTDIGLS